MSRVRIRTKTPVAEAAAASSSEDKPLLKRARVTKKAPTKNTTPAQPRKPPAKKQPVTTLKPNPLAWERALELANGDRRRLKTVEGEVDRWGYHPVLVRN